MAKKENKNAKKENSKNKRTRANKIQVTLSLILVSTFAPVLNPIDIRNPCVPS